MTAVIDMTPGQMLGAAEDLLAAPGRSAVGGWPRAVALLARQALEKAIDEFWVRSAVTAPVRACSMKTQLLCLPSYADPVLAREVSYTWSALSSACHTHAYELAPISAELRSWIASVRLFLEYIDRPQMDARCQPAQAD